MHGLQEPASYSLTVATRRALAHKVHRPDNPEHTEHASLDLQAGVLFQGYWILWSKRNQLFVLICRQTNQVFGLALGFSTSGIRALLRLGTQRQRGRAHRAGAKQQTQRALFEKPVGADVFWHSTKQPGNSCRKNQPTQHDTFGLHPLCPSGHKVSICTDAA